MIQESRLESCLPGTNEALVADALVSLEEQEILVAWAEDQLRAGKLKENPQDRGAFATPFRSANRELTRFTRDGVRQSGDGAQKFVWVPPVDVMPPDPLPDEFWSIRSRVIEYLGLDGLEEDHYKGSFLSYIAPGTGVHEHRDARIKMGMEELLIFRCNVLFRKPQGGGLPVFGARELDIPDRAMWAFFPTELVHGASEVRGTHFRGLLSFGFLVRSSDIWKRRFRIAPAFVSEHALDSGPGVRHALLETLATRSRTAGIGYEQLELFRFVLSASGDFSLLEAAQSLGRNPAQVSEMLHGLQKTNVVESCLNVLLDRGRIVAF